MIASEFAAIPKIWTAPRERICGAIHVIVLILFAPKCLKACLPLHLNTG